MERSQQPRRMCCVLVSSFVIFDFSALKDAHAG